MKKNEWNEKYTVGTKVLYFPIKDEPYHVITRTRSEAWELSCGSSVVKIEGTTGGVLLSHLKVLEKSC